MTFQELLEDILPRCTVRIELGGRHEGTGFLVAPGVVVTCYHVIERHFTSQAEIKVIPTFTEEPLAATVTGDPCTETDVAVLRISGLLDHPCVLLDERRPSPGDELYAFGFPNNQPLGASLRVKSTGLGPDDTIRIQGDQVEPGMSGAPVINATTGTTCGVVRWSRDPRSAAGGYVIPVSVVLACAQLLEGNVAFHRANSTWLDHLTTDQKRMSDPVLRWIRGGARAGRDTRMLITVGPQEDKWEVTCDFQPPLDTPLAPVSVDLNVVRLRVARLFRDWALAGREPENEKVRLLGGILYDAIMANSIGAAFADHLPDSPNDRLLLSLRFTDDTDPELVRLPWEYLEGEVNGREFFFATEGRVALSRRLSDEEVAGHEPQTQLSVLLVKAFPPPAPVGGAGGEGMANRDLVDRALSALENNHPPNITLKTLNTPSLDELETELKAGYDVVHYVGFGRLEGGTDEVMMGIEPGLGREGDISYYDGGLFSPSFDSPAPPRLVVLQILPAGDSVPADMASLGPQLIRDRGIEAVLAFQYPIAPELISLFNDRFYKEIGRGVPLQSAVQAARAKLRTGGQQISPRAFVCPALFTRGPTAIQLVGAELAGRTKPPQRSGIG